MTATTRRAIPYGPEQREVTLPERTRIVSPNPPLEPLADFPAAVRAALAEPLGTERLDRLVTPRSKVVIAFDDPAGPTYPKSDGWADPRQIVLTTLLEELERIGVERSNLRLICANALHRKWTQAELASILGTRIAYGFGPAHLFCHDAEDRENLIHLGETARGMEVEVSRFAVEADQLIYVGLPKSLFNGGWKSTVVGLSSFRSIQHHHRPWPFAKGHSVEDLHTSSFHKIMRELGEHFADELAKRSRQLFQIEIVNNNAIPPRPIGVFAGQVERVHAETIKLMEQQLVVPAEGQSDVLIYGLDDRFETYSKFARTNPILVLYMSLFHSLGRYQGHPLIREGGILIVHHPLPLDFDDLHFPSYRELYEQVLPAVRDANEGWELFGADFANRPEYVHAYRHRFGYHGAHPFFMWGRQPTALKHLGGLYLAGATDPEVARRLGFEPFPSLEAALDAAQRNLGPDCSITLIDAPPVPIARVSV
jgi:nickel-dependent lactate racemase